MAVGRHALDLAETGVAQEPHREVTALGDAAALGGDRGLANPLLQPGERLVVTLLDLLVDRFEVGRGPRAARQHRCGPDGRRAVQEGSTHHGPALYAFPIAPIRAIPSTWATPPTYRKVPGERVRFRDGSPE